MQKDFIQRFLIEDFGIRGQIVRMNQCWRDLCACADYPDRLLQILAQASVASALLGSTLKYDGRLTLQITGTGAVSLVNIQMSSNNTLRGLIRWKGDVSNDSNLSEMCGADHMSITVSTGKSRRDYQGIVALRGHTIGSSIEEYMSNSEQVPTQLWFARSQDEVAGMLLQQLPDVPCPSAMWEEFVALVSTVSNDELLRSDTRHLLRQLFSCNTVRLFTAKTLRFHCTCSVERIESVLRSLGYQECLAVLREEECVDVTCEYCNKHYTFNASQIADLFKQTLNDVPNKLH